MTLREIIATEIRQRGPIPFSRYMELCLYHPTLGYYSRERERFGMAGDFYTSSDIHAVYGRLLARQFDEMWQVLDRPVQIRVMELGPGRGLFAHDLLAWAQNKFPAFASALTYVMVESSAELRNSLGERFQTECMAGSVEIHESLASVQQGDAAVVFANEFFDAMPVEVLSDKGELHVDVDDRGCFVERWCEPSGQTLEFLNRYGVAPAPGERVEAAPQMAEWVGNISAKFSRGFCVFVDYGYTRQELLAGRHRDTVRAFRKHTMSANVYEAPGEQDITADVNFSALADFGQQNGMAAMPPVTQSQFLLGIGEQTEFSDVFEGCVLPQEHAKRALQLKHLVTPVGMGEAFHVLLLAKEVEKEKAARLSGLNFGKTTVIR